MLSESKWFYHELETPLVNLKLKRFCFVNLKLKRFCLVNLKLKRFCFVNLKLKRFCFVNLKLKRFCFNCTIAVFYVLWTIYRNKSRGRLDIPQFNWPICIYLTFYLNIFYAKLNKFYSIC